MAMAAPRAQGDQAAARALPEANQIDPRERLDGQTAVVMILDDGLIDRTVETLESITRAVTHASTVNLDIHVNGLCRVQPNLLIRTQHDPHTVATKT